MPGKRKYTFKVFGGRSEVELEVDPVQMGLQDKELIDDTVFQFVFELEKAVLGRCKNKRDIALYIEHNPSCPFFLKNDLGIKIVRFTPLEVYVSDVILSSVEELK